MDSSNGRFPGVTEESSIVVLKVRDLGVFTHARGLNELQVHTDM